MRLKYLLLMLVIFSLSACVPTGEVQPSPTGTATEKSLSTATIDWFPATSTPDVQPPPIPSTTPNSIPSLGDVIFEDRFLTSEGWIVSRTSRGEISIAGSEINIVINQPNSYLYAYREKPDLENYYVQIQSKPSLCSGRDEYGLLFRLTNDQNFYRYSLSCRGEVRLEKISAGGVTTLQPWTRSASVPDGAPSISNLEVLAQEQEMSFFINGDLQFKAVDEELKIGSFGVFGKSTGDSAYTVSFSDLVVRSLVEN
jgi:hypothetical protein